MRPSLACLAAAALLAGCVPPPPPPIPVADGYAHYRGSGRFQCGGPPVSLDGSHTNVTLDGACTRVLIRGSHNDILVYVAPGALIDVYGESNDITWRLVRPGRPPTLRADGPRNDFHRNSRLPWQQDHDWYQEQY